MSMRWVLVLAVVICLVNEAIASRRIPSRSLRMDKYAAVDDRNDEADNEERIKVPGLSKIAELASRASPKAQNTANKMWLWSQTNPEDVFKALRVGEAGTKLNNNPHLLQWLKYVQMYRGQKGPDNWFPDKQIFSLLLAMTKRQIKLALLFQSLTRHKNLGEKMQTLLIEKWISKKNKARAYQEVVENH